MGRNIVPRLWLGISRMLLRRHRSRGRRIMSLTLYLLVMKLRVLHWRLCWMSKVLLMLRMGRHRRRRRRMRRRRRSWARRVLVRVHLMGLLHCAAILLHVRWRRTVAVGR